MRCDIRMRDSMIRTLLFMTLLALTVVSASTPTAPAYASGEKKGILGFFNRADNDGSKTGQPIHMQSGIDGSSGSDGGKPMSLGRREKAARYEDSPVNAERERQAKAFDDWNKNEVAKADASTAALMEQVMAQQAYNLEMGRQQQAQIMAQGGTKISAGTPPPANPAAMAAMQAAQQRAQISGIPTNASPSSAPQASAPEEEAPAATKRERKPRNFFNRITE